MKLLTTSLLVLLGILAGLLTVLLLPWLFVTFLSGWLPRPAPAPHVDDDHSPTDTPLVEQILRDEWVRGVELWLEMVKGKHE
jgi:hypothetical protein